MSTRVLQIMGSMNRGGAETVVMNWYRCTSSDKIQFDFIVHTDNVNDYENEILDRGGKVFHIHPLRKNPMRHCCELLKILKDNEYIAVHRHASNAVMAVDLLLAKFQHVHIRVAHSHNESSIINNVLHLIMRFFLNKVATVKIACSPNAAKWMFGEKTKVLLLNNSIPLGNYKFNPLLRASIRTELNVANKLIIGHVGRFNPVKNHKFLLEVFSEIKKENSNVELWLVGDGELRSELESITRTLGLNAEVKFWGVVENVNELLNAMDIFVLPSLYEGFPMVLIEAQASGLPCIVSDTVTGKAKLSRAFSFLPIQGNEASYNWKEQILKTQFHDRTDINYNTLTAYDSLNTVQTLMKIYEGC